MICNTAIFYDIENLLGLFGGKTNTVLHLDEIYRRVLEMEGVHGVSIQRAYADWGLQQHRNLRNSVLQVGIEPVQIFNTNPNDKVKNASDVFLIIDAVDLLHKKPEVENYVIASGDGIFAFLAKKLHEHGKRVIGCSFERITNNIFRNSCDYFIGLEKSDSSIIATCSKRKSKSALHCVEPADSANDVSEEEESPQNPAGNFPKTKYTEILAGANLPVWRDVNDTSGCFHAVRRLVEVLFDAHTKDSPGLEISIFTNYMNYYLPEFKPSRHGFKRVSDFLRFILSGSPYCMYYAEKNVLLIAPRDFVERKMMEDVNGLLVTSASGSKYNSVFNLPAGEPFVYTILPEAENAPPEEVKNKKKTKAVKHKEPVNAEPANLSEEKANAEPVSPSEEPANAKPASPSEEKENSEPAFAVPAPAEPEEVKIVSIRKWIKECFEELSEKDALPSKEIRKLITEEYSLATFGVRNPILKLIVSRSNLAEQRTANGKVKYWKESFKFGGKMYLVYKEWAASLHEQRFAAWIAAIEE